MNIPKPTDRLADCVWLPRLIFKAREFEAGRLPEEYAVRFCHPTGIDGRFLEFFHLTKEEVLAASRKDDASVAEWFLADEARRDRVAAWNELAVNLGRPGYPLAERLAALEKTSYAHLVDRGYATIFEVLAADDAMS